MLLTFSLFRRRTGHGQANTRRRTVGTHRTVAAPSQTTVNPLSGSQAARQSCGAHRHSLRLTDRPALEPTASRDGLRQRHEAGVAYVTGKPLASGSSCTRCCLRDCARPTKSTGLASSSTPLQSALWAQVKNRTESHRPRATRFKAPSHHRSAGYPARGNPHGRQPPRCYPASPTG